MMDGGFKQCFSGSDRRRSGEEFMKERLFPRSASVDCGETEKVTILFIMTRHKHTLGHFFFSQTQFWEALMIQGMYGG